MVGGSLYNLNMNKHILVKKLVVSITVSLGFLTFDLFIGGIMPCDAGYGKCGPSLLFFAFPCLAVIILIHMWALSIKKKVDLSTENNSRVYNVIIPTLIFIQAIVSVPFILLLFFMSFPSESYKIFSYFFE